MRLTLESSQLLIVDVQERLVPAILNPEETIDRCVRLIKAAQRMDMPVTISEQYPKGLGATVPAIKDALNNQAVILEKVHFSCLRNEPLCDHLRDNQKDGRGAVVVAGIEAHVCVAQTIMDLETQGFDAFLVADAVSSRSPSSKALALSRLARMGANIVDSEMVLFEWLDKAGSQEFKDLQALLK